MSLMLLLLSKVSPVSVTIVWARISIALSWRLCFLTKSSLASTAAPGPSDVGQHWSLVSGSWTIGAASMSSMGSASWTCEEGLLTAGWWFVAQCLRTWYGGA